MEKKKEVVGSHDNRCKLEVYDETAKSALSLYVYVQLLICLCRMRQTAYYSSTAAVSLAWPVAEMSLGCFRLKGWSLQPTRTVLCC